MDISFTVCSFFVCLFFVFVPIRISSPRTKLAAFTFCSAVRQRPRQGITNLCELCSPEAQNWTNGRTRGPRPPACKHYRRDALP